MWIRSWLPTFQKNLSDPFPNVKQPIDRKNILLLSYENCKQVKLQMNSNKQQDIEPVIVWHRRSLRYWHSSWRRVKLQNQLELDDICKKKCSLAVGFSSLWRPIITFLLLRRSICSQKVRNSYSLFTPTPIPTHPLTAFPPILWRCLIPFLRES